MPRRYTYELVKQYIEAENGYELLEKSYKNARTKLKIRCNSGHIYKAPWYVFKMGHRCKICGREKVSHKQKHEFNFIKKALEQEKYKLNALTYKNARQPLEVTCPKNHKIKITWNVFQQGGRCGRCFGTPKKKIGQIRKHTKLRGYELLSSEYINAFTKLQFKCSNSHIFEASWNNFNSRKSGCPICFRINNYGPNHCNWRGGISFEPYCYIFSDKEFKDYIKERDGHMCLNPACSRNIKTLAIHHIDYNKKNCIQENLITLCTSCNSKANIDREWHTHWYRLIMMYRYKFKYEEIL